MKIHIIGGPGSGKTTLAKELSAKLNLKLFSLDEIVWDNTSVLKRNSDEYRQKKADEILVTDNYICEGVYYDWSIMFFESADIIIYLNINKYIRNFRILKRYIKRKLCFYKKNKDSIFLVSKLIKSNKKFEEKAFYYLNCYRDKMFIVNKKRDIRNLFLNSKMIKVKI